MNAALRIAQFEYDNRIPVDLTDPAEQEWIENGVDELMRGGDVQFKRFGRQAQGVSYERFATAVDEFVADQLGDPGSSPSVIGRLILSARRKSSSEAASAANEALNSADPDEALREIARELLRPFARDGVIAQREDSL